MGRRSYKRVPRRDAVLQALAEGPMTVHQLCEAQGVQFPAMRKALVRFAADGLVERKGLEAVPLAASPRWRGAKTLTHYRVKWGLKR